MLKSEKAKKHVKRWKVLTGCFIYIPLCLISVFLLPIVLSLVAPVAFDFLTRHLGLSGLTGALGPSDFLTFFGVVLTIGFSAFCYWLQSREQRLRDSKRLEKIKPDAMITVTAEDAEEVRFSLTNVGTHSIVNPAISNETLTPYLPVGKSVELSISFEGVAAAIEPDGSRRSLFPGCQLVNIEDEEVSLVIPLTCCDTEGRTWVIDYFYSDGYVFAPDPIYCVD